MVEIGRALGARSQCRRPRDGYRLNVWTVLRHLPREREGLCKAQYSRGQTVSTRDGVRSRPALAGKARLPAIEVLVASLDP